MNTDKIAAGAADKCYERMMTGGYPVILKEDMAAIIKSTIEKGVISALKKYEGKCPICGAPHASDLYRISPINAKYLMQKYPNIIKPAHASEPPQSRGGQGAERLIAIQGNIYCGDRLVATMPTFEAAQQMCDNLNADLSQRPTAAVNDNEENKYRDLAAERWNLYHELLMAVENKYEGESRHETALRLIREAQKSDTSTSQEKA